MSPRSVVRSRCRAIGESADTAAGGDNRAIRLGELRRRAALLHGFASVSRSARFFVGDDAIIAMQVKVAFGVISLIARRRVGGTVITNDTIAISTGARGLRRRDDRSSNRIFH